MNQKSIGFNRTFQDKVWYMLLLLVFPIMYLVFEYFKLPLIPHYYSTNPDPTYIYLMNGLNIASGNWELGHYDNPGTPLHVLTGFLLWVTHLFAGKGDIISDVLTHPEFYITSCLSMLFFLKALALFFIGYKISRVTKNLLIGIGFQLIPLFILLRLSTPGLIHPDLLLDTLCLLFMVFLFPVLYQNKEPRSFTEMAKSIAPLAAIVGAMAATKISSIGLVFIPLFVFAGWRSKALFLITGIAFFYFFTLPVISRLDEFFNFIVGIAGHKGQYGHGEEGFVELSNFTNNIYRLYTTEKTLLITYAISLIGGVFFSIKQSNKWSLLLLGIAATYTFQTIVIGKHFSYHYTVPMHYLFILSLFGLAKLLKEAGFLNWIKNKKWIVPMGLLIFLLAGVIRASNHNIFVPYESAKMLSTDSFLANREQPTLIFPGESSYLTSSYVQSALWFGKFYAGYITRWDRANQLETIYPSYYFNSSPSGKVEDWNTVLPFWMICKRHDMLDIYVRDKSEYDVEQFIHTQLKKESWPNKVFSHKKIFENKASGEVIYQLEIDTVWFSKNYITVYKKEMTFNEEPQKELFVAKDMSKPKKLATIEVNADDFVTASIWRKTTNKKCFIEFRGNNGFYKHTGYITERKGEWEKITLTHEVSSDQEDSLAITVRNATRDAAFFDDLEISIIRGRSVLGCELLNNACNNWL